MKKIIFMLFIAITGSSLVFAIDIDREGSSKYTSTSVKTDINDISKKVNINGRTWSVVDFSNPQVQPETTPHMTDLEKKRKFKVVDYNEPVTPPADINSVHSATDTVTRDTKVKVVDYSSKGVKDSPTSSRDKDMEWREWAEQQLKMYQEKKKSGNK